MGTCARDDFGDLHTLEPGDTVTWTTKLGTCTYEVVSVQKVLETDTSGTAATSDDRLTLYTCEMQLLGSSSKRVGVVCKLTDKAFYTDAGTSAEGGNQ